VKGRGVLVTGGNTGIGLEAAVALARLGAAVAITSRDAERGKRAVDEIRERAGVEAPCLPLDLGSFRSIRACAAEALERFPRLHVLVNNAGLVLSDRRTTEDGLEATLGINHFGPFLLTKLLLERLKDSAPARIVNVASAAHRRSRGIDFSDLQAERGYDGRRRYGDSKLANILFTRELARRLAGSGVTANALHPGVVATRFGLDGDATGAVRWFFTLARPFLLSAEAGARTTVHVASAAELERVSGRYFARCREATPTRYARDDQAARRLWEESERLTDRRASAPNQ
jgi:NAD(P)-dependent dehydrogenase (short-subunit alcohol dehydrogenase family)